MRPLVLLSRIALVLGLLALTATAAPKKKSNIRVQLDTNTPPPVSSVAVTNKIAPPSLLTPLQTLNTPRAFPQFNAPEEWREHARQLRQHVLVSCGLWPLPEKSPLKVRIFGKVRRDGYTIEKVHFQTWPGFYLAGNLYRPYPLPKGPVPGILNPHGHWPNGRLADTAEGSVAARCIHFARHGMTAFTYDMVGYNDTRFGGNTNAPGYTTHRQFGTNASDQLWSISLMGLQTWNSIRALDFLESLPEIDKNRLACTGESGGGTQTFMLGAADDRLAAQAPVVMVSHSMQGGCSCENAPGLRVDASNMEIAAAAAPRPQMLVAATGDWTKDTLKIEGPALAGIYRLLGAPAHFQYVCFDAGHNYNQASREAVYGFFDQCLFPSSRPAKVKEAPYTKEKDDDLRVWPNDVLPEDALSEDALTRQLIQQCQTQRERLKPTSPAGLKPYQDAYLPLWRHALQLATPTSTKDPIVSFQTLDDFHDVRLEFTLPGRPQPTPARLLIPISGSSSTVVVMMREDGCTNWNDRADQPTGLPANLLQRKLTLLMLDPGATGARAGVPRQKNTSPFENFFTTYNRTDLQEHLLDLQAACAYARTVGRQPPPRLILYGAGRAGLWALLAAPMADAVVADAIALDLTTDVPYQSADWFFPGVKRLGGFEGAASLAAPHPLFIHNAGGNFSTRWLSDLYAAVGAASALRVEAAPAAVAAIQQWIEGQAR